MVEIAVPSGLGAGATYATRLVTAGPADEGLVRGGAGGAVGVLGRDVRATHRRANDNGPRPSDGGRWQSWQIQDSNLGRHKPTDLQSAPIGRSGNLPCLSPTGLAVCSGGRKNSKARPPTRNHQEAARWPTARSTS
jgi:hypothetical protein